MNVFLSDNEIIKKIKEYSQPNWIWIDVWKMSRHEIQVVVTVNVEENVRLGQHEVIHLCSAQTEDVDDVIKLKNYGRLIVKLIRKNFPHSKVHSRLYYR